MRERQHGHKNANRASDTEHGDDGGCPPGANTSQVINQRDCHGQTLRSAFTTRMRMALKPGRSPLTIPTAMATTRPSKSTVGARIKVGSKPLRALASAGTASKASNSP